MAGKGSKPRPFNVDRKTFESNWDQIFKKQQQQPERVDVEKQKEQAQDRRNG